MGKGHQRTPNDQRSDVHNKNSPEWKAINDNRSVQGQQNKAASDREEHGDSSSNE